MKAKAVSTVMVSQYFTRASVCLAALTALAIFTYSVLLLMTVLHAAARQSAQMHINSLATQVGSLEASYLQQTQNITPATASQLGFVDPTIVSTVYADGGTHALSLRTTR